MPKLIKLTRSNGIPVAVNMEHVAEIVGFNNRNILKDPVTRILFNFRASEHIFYEDVVETFDQIMESIVYFTEPKPKKEK